MDKKFRLRTLFNALFFVLLIYLTYHLIFRDQDITNIFSLICNANKMFLLLGIFFIFMFLFMESYNIKKLLGALGNKINILSAIKYTFIGYFFSSITPAASGGQPVEIYCMTKDKVDGAKATVSLLIHLCTFQFVTILTGLVCAIINYDLLKDGFIYLFIVGISLNFIALLAMVFATFSKKITNFALNIVFIIMCGLRIKDLEKKKKNINDSLDKYHESALFIKNNKKELLKSIVRVLIQVVFYYLAPYFIYRSFGLSEYTMLRMFSLQAVLFISVSSIPLPGAIGISEGAFLSIYRSIYGDALLGSAMLLTRFSTFYLFVIICLIVVIIDALKRKD